MHYKGTKKSLPQIAGSLGSHGTYSQTGGFFEYRDGAIDGSFLLFKDVKMELHGKPLAATFRGSANTLITDIPDGSALTVEGTDQGDGVLTTSSLTNEGAIVLSGGGVTPHPAVLQVVEVIDDCIDAFCFHGGFLWQRRPARIGRKAARKSQF